MWRRECVLETPREQSKETPPILLSVFILSEKTQRHEPPCSPDTCSPDTCSPDTCLPGTCSPETGSPETGSPECVRIHLSVFNILKIIQSTTCWATNLSDWISWRFKSFGCKHDNKYIYQYVKEWGHVTVWWITDPSLLLLWYNDFW